MTGRVAPGWHPDYEAPPGHQRYWDGVRWTERRSGVPEEPQVRVEEKVWRLAPWVLAGVAVLVLSSAAVLVMGEDQTARSSDGPSPPPTASTPGPPPSETAPAEESETDRRTWQVDAVIDGSTLRLTNGAEVRLVGIAAGCSADALAKLAVGRHVTLTRRGPDKDSDGRLLRYVERNGADVGKRLIQRGWARASDEPSSRRDIYRRVDERSTDRC